MKDEGVSARPLTQEEEQLIRAIGLERSRSGGGG